MFNRFNTRNLLIVFLVLLALVLITIPSGNKKNRSFKSQLSQFDVEEATAFHVEPRGGAGQLSFRISDDNWLVGDASGEFNADDRQVEQLLESIADLKAKRLAGKGRDSWEKYELTDSLSTRVAVLDGEKVLAEVYIGKFNYTQPTGPQNPYQQPQGTMTTYVRVGKDREVYAVDGFLSMSFNRPLTDYRDSRVVEADKDRLRRIAVMRDGQNYDLIRNEASWRIDGLEADSVAMDEYLEGLTWLRSRNYLPAQDPPSGNPSHQLRLEGESGEVLVHVDAWYADSTDICVSSSLNPGTWFDGTQNGLFEKLFADRSSLGAF